jgi:hypothetical protein
MSDLPKRIASVGVIALAGLFLAATGSARAVGPLAPAKCWESPPGANPACAGLTGVGAPSAAVLSRDGRSLFVIGSGGGGMLSDFSRDPASGDLTFRQCFTGPSTATTSCTEVPGMEYPGDIEATADGRSVYVLSDSNGLLSFTRNPATGDLSFSSCLFDGYDRSVPAGCSPVDAFGTPTDLAASPDGRRVYVSGAEYPEEWGAVGDLLHHWLVTFRRDPGSGQLTRIHRQKGFGVPESMAVSPDGESLYAISGGVIRYATSGNGSLRLAWCRAAVNGKHCRRAPGIGAVVDIALGPRARSLLVLSRSTSPRPVRAGGVASFALSREGRLSFRGCVEDSSAGFGPRCRRIGRAGMIDPSALTLSGDGRWAFVVATSNAGPGGGSLVALRRGGRSGKLAFSQCFDGFSPRCSRPSPFTIGAPFPPPWRVASSLDGSFLYLPSGGPTGAPSALLAFRSS